MALINSKQIKGLTAKYADVAKLVELLNEKVENGTTVTGDFADGNPNGSSLIGFTYVETKELAKNNEDNSWPTIPEEFEISYIKKENGETTETNEADATHVRATKTTKYSVSDALQTIKDDIQNIFNDSDELDNRIKAIETKTIQDYVKVSGTIGENATISFNLANKGEIKVDQVVDIYTEDNKVIFVKTANGYEALTYKVNKDTETQALQTVINTTGSLDNKLYIVNADAKQTTKDAKVAYTEFAGTTVKAFFVSKFAFGTIAEDFLLDNNELKIVTQDAMLATIINRLAEDEYLRDQIASALDKQAIEEAVKESGKTFNARITKNEIDIAELQNDLATADFEAQATKNITKAEGESDEDYALRVQAEVKRLQSTASIKVDEVAKVIRTEGAVDTLVATEKAVADVNKNLQDQIDDNENDIERIDSRIRTVEATSIDTLHTDKVTYESLGENKYTIKLTETVIKPGSPIKLFINGIVYSSALDKVTYAQQSATAATEEVSAQSAYALITFNSDFALDNEDEIAIEYITSKTISSSEAGYEENAKLYAYTTDHKLGAKPQPQE